MDDTMIANRVELRGTVCCRPIISHESRGERFFKFPLEVQRLSGAVDTINILAKEHQLNQLLVTPDEKLRVLGELRSYNNKSGEGSRLVISVLARELDFETDHDINNALLTGSICKPPSLRATPMGREICDIMLAVNRRYGRSDYLPCIVWGSNAREASEWSVGNAVHISGRMQSRKYIKNLDGNSVERTAFEISVMEISRL